MFLKRAFDKYGVQADYEQRYEYKNAVNPYLYDDYHAGAPGGGARLDGVGLSTASWLRRRSSTAALAPGAAPEPRWRPGPSPPRRLGARGLIDQVGQVQAAQDQLAADGPGRQRRQGGGLRPAYRSARPAPRPPRPRRRAPSPCIGAEGDIVTGTGADRAPGSARRPGSTPTTWPRRFYDAIDDDRRSRRSCSGSPRPAGRTPPRSRSWPPCVAAEAARQAGGGLHGDLRGVGRLLDLVAGVRDRGRAHHPDRLHRRVRRQAGDRARAGAASAWTLRMA